MAAEARAKLRAEGVALQPVTIDGRHIARTFWAKAWCDHLESFSDYANRLPRGRTYVRNGSVFHLVIERGTVAARVQGTRLYRVVISITGLSPQRWKAIRSRCTGKIGSVLDLLQGKLSEPVMRVVTDRKEGLFPQPREIRMQCSCPDWAGMCKHIAAVLYGVGARLDQRPELLFLLRGVDYEELIDVHAATAVAEAVARKGGGRRIPESDLADIFGVELAEPLRPDPAGTRRGRKSPEKAASGVAAFPAEVTGNDVRLLRTRMGLTLTELARMLGVSPAAVSVWERKKKSVLGLQGWSRKALRRVWEAAT
jgi:uncharacterized Zn finger protein/DNA-binding transcriptional regulator YiaG